ncbi:MAG TPA: nucleoside-diphosphate sugar epimerase/dehydratase [Dehalococcoidia bacterium]|nr:nucleoside-diphosphate sugar epimerase/dehydratase [Dehalococcoidia bacterium]
MNSDLMRRAGRFGVSLLLDVGIVIAAYALGLELKFDGAVPNESWRTLAWAGPLIAFAYLLTYQALGVYETAWQYGSLRDAVLLATGVTLVTASVLIINALLPHRPIPLTVNVIAAAFLLLGHGMVRMLPRLWRSTDIGTATEKPRQRVMVVGAGDPGQLLAWELQHSRSQPYRAVCFVDDDPVLRNKRVHGIPVAGGRYDIPDLIKKYDVDLVAIALPPERAPGLQEVLALIEPAKIPVRLVPAVKDVMEGRAERGEMREITVEDLLAREPMDVNVAASRASIAGRVVLITGAAGSIGAELTRRVTALKPAALHLIDSNETGLHELRVEVVQQSGGDIAVRPWLVNISDRKALDDIFEASRPQVVFHLAAYKHIRMMEENPDQAFETNIIGTLNVFEAAQAVQAEEVVFLSSHTAVNPASVYGASKRIGELLVSSMPRGRTRFCAVRLTNVIDARGTVLALFARQIQGGGPVSVTDPEVARYFLTISEVAGLVIQAAALARGGDIFLLDTGEEVRIAELAERLIRARGMEPGKDIEIIYTGLRPGEKVSEALTGEHETLEPTEHARVLRAVSSLTLSGAELRAAIRELEVDRRRRTGNLPARIHALARFELTTAGSEPEAVETPQEP